MSSLAQKAFPANLLEDSISVIIFLSSKPLVKDNRILLQWKSSGLEKSGFYIIERSIDEKVYEVIGVIKAGEVGDAYEFLDEKPSRSKNYYRIKMPLTDKKTVYSHTITAGIAGSIFCKFYPNPVDKLLILRSDYTVELKITDETGKVRILKQLQPGLQSVDVSSLEKNIYIITISQQESNQVISKKLIKN
ncbi:MAG: T9SS type A sorting domain-containing protein [Chitinophagaceae bacterium]